MIYDFNNKPLKIKKKGKIYPVDVELTEEGKDVLNISVNICFWELVSDMDADLSEWKKAVIEGIRDWGGEYKVFGDQPLSVRISVEETDKIIDSVIIAVYDEEMSKTVVDQCGKLNYKKINELFGQGRSCAVKGLPIIGWKSYAPRLVCLMHPTLRDLNYARAASRHEFGHVLGLGDLYKDPENGLQGVDGGAYKDIEKYYLGDSYYNMVMCNNGPVRDNDIEMLLLAFETDKFQNYQKQKKRDKISEALGKGN